MALGSHPVKLINIHGRDLAEEGIRSALYYAGVDSKYAVVNVKTSYTDTTAECVKYAAFLATLKALDKDIEPEFYINEGRLDLLIKERNE